MTEGVKPKAKLGRRFYVADEQSKRYVEAMATIGRPHDEIARVIRCSAKTLRKHYREQLDMSALKANAMVARSLYYQAVGGPEHDWTKASTSAAIFFAKCRMGWHEPKQEIGLSGSVGSYDLTKLSDGELANLKEIARIAARPESDNAALEPDGDRKRDTPPGA